MCKTCNYKIGNLKTMNTKDLVKNALSTALGVGGAVAGQELRKLVPAETLDPMYTNLGLVLLGGLVVPMVAKGKSGNFIKSAGNGLAIEAGLQLVNTYLMPTADTTVSGLNNGGVGLYGLNNAGPGVYGNQWDSQANGSFTPNGSQMATATIGL